MTDFLRDKQHIHFIGIGGSGMFPLAQILHGKGYYLTGSDNNETETLKEVRRMGIDVFMGHNPDNIKGADLIIYSAAILEDNPELAAARIAERKSGAEVRIRADLLGLVTDWFDKAVCVSGTHGKTTVSSMLTHIFLADSVDVSAVIGGKLKLINGSARIGKDEIMVCEACEFNDTFLKLSPNITVVLNIDEDHLDYFKTLDNLKESFSKFCGMTTDILAVNGDDENTMDAVSKSGFKGKIFTFGRSADNDFYAEKIERISDFQTDFALMQNGIHLADISIFVPGEHNILNALASCAAAIACGCSLRAINEGLRGFWGAGRRFERLYENNGIVVVDDYAHHPAEIAATLKTAKQMNFKRVWAIHQPFTFSRTATFLDDFAEALKIADKVILTEIMGGREKNTYGINSGALAEKVGNAIVLDSFKEIAEYVMKYAEADDLIITLGCGDIYKAAYLIVDLMKEKV